MNMADHFTKQLPPVLFSRHVDHILGHVPPPYSPNYKLYAGHVPTTNPNASSLKTVALPRAGDNNSFSMFHIHFNSLYRQWFPIVWHRFFSSPCSFSEARTVGGYQYEST